MLVKIWRDDLDAPLVNKDCLAAKNDRTCLNIASRTGFSQCELEGALADEAATLEEMNVTPSYIFFQSYINVSNEHESGGSSHIDNFVSHYVENTDTGWPALRQS